MIYGHKKTIEGWTDYPFTELGDIPYQQAPWRRCVVVGYDGDKYATIKINGVSGSKEVKAGYVKQFPSWSSPNVDVHALVREE